MSYAHLSQAERYQIRCSRKDGWPLEAIGVELQRAPSTISRELRRNVTQEGGYDHRYARCQAVQRRHAASAVPRIDPETWATVEACLREDWSPEQIAGTDKVAVSTERIYQHIATDRQRVVRFGNTCASANDADATAAAHRGNANALRSAHRRTSRHRRTS